VKVAFGVASGQGRVREPQCAFGVRRRFDVLIKTRAPKLHRHWATRDLAANLRLYRLVAEVLAAIEAGVFHPIVGWQCRECAFRSKCWAWG
jgi:hypothetical protein